MSCKLESWENGIQACFECIIDGGVGSAHVQVGASRVPRELADGGRVSSPINSDGGDGGDGQDNGDGDVEGYDCGDVDDHDHDGCL